MFAVVSIVGNYVHLCNVYLGGRETYQMTLDSKGNIDLSGLN